MRQLTSIELQYVNGGTKSTPTCKPGVSVVGGLIGGLGTTLVGLKKVAVSLLAAPLVLIGSLFSHKHGCDCACTGGHGGSAAG